MNLGRLPSYIATLLLGSGLAVVTHSKTTTVDDLEAACPQGGCMQCVTDNCPLLVDGLFIVDAPDTSELRCVDYDGVPPAHCVRVTVDHKYIYDYDPPMFVGYCSRIRCDKGVPTAETCIAPWIKPTTGPGL